MASVLPDWAVLNLIVRVNIGLGGWTSLGSVRWFFRHINCIG